MEKVRNETTEQLEKMLLDYIAGKGEYPGEVVLAACETLSQRSAGNADVTEIYRLCLSKVCPWAIKNDL